MWRCGHVPVRQDAGEALFLQALWQLRFQRVDTAAGAVHRESRLRGRCGYVCAGNDSIRRQEPALIFEGIRP